MKYRQGLFKPSNPSKYKGDVSNIVYRSGWELKVFLKLDSNPNVLRWSSEETVIPYKSPIDGRWHRYFVDCYAELKQADGTKKTVLLEIKPSAQTQAPDMSKKHTAKGTLSKRFLTEVQTYGINTAKWAAAEEYCKDRGWEFKILTEKDIF
jgi:hypothetical protein